MRKIINELHKTGVFAPKRLLLIVLGAAICSFGIHNVHNQSGITEGGVLGAILLLNHWLSVPPSIISPVLDILCYALAYKVLGMGFLALSAVATVSLSAFFRLWESLPYALPDMTSRPLIAALTGALFIGVGVGLVVRQGGSCGGDDALALAISRLTKRRLALSYLITDITVLLLSLSYIPFSRIAYSLITVTLSSWLIDLIQGKGDIAAHD